MSCYCTQLQKVLQSSENSYLHTSSMMSDEPKEIHYLPGYAGPQTMTRVIQLNVFPWQISPIMLQTKKEFFTVVKDSLRWDPVRALSCLGLLLAIYSSHQCYAEILKIISLFHWCSMCIWCQGKRERPVLSLQLCHRNWGLSRPLEEHLRRAQN